MSRAPLSPKAAEAPLLEAARRVQRPTIFLPGLPSLDPVEFDRWDSMADRLGALAGDRALAFRPGRAAWPGFDDFWSITATADGAYLCTLADRWRDAADRDAALRILRASQLARVA